MKKVILASQSPRRHELLTQMGVEHDVKPSNFAEELDDSRSPEEVAMALALGKAMAVAKQYPDSLVIGSDTIVTIEGKQLEKPVDNTDAHRILKLLSGKPNHVSTGVAIVRLADDTRFVGADTTKVFFRPYDEEAVSRYAETDDPLDKAGAYGIQSSGAAPLISHIEGHYDTVVGLPTKLLNAMLTEVGMTGKNVDLEPPIKQVLPDSYTPTYSHLAE